MLKFKFFYIALPTITNTTLTISRRDNTTEKKCYSELRANDSYYNIKDGTRQLATFVGVFQGFCGYLKLLIDFNNLIRISTCNFIV